MPLPDFDCADLRVTRKLRSDDLVSDPFPLLIARNVLDEKVFRELRSTMPPLDIMLKGQDYGSNARVNYSATNMAFNPQSSDLWKKLFQDHLNQGFLDDVLRLFRPHILKYYPDFETRYAPISSLKAGIRKIDEESDANVLLDTQLAVNTPVVLSGTTVRGPHVDCPKKLFVGLLYFRAEDDDSTGGDLEVYRSKISPPELDVTRTGDPDDMELVYSVPYEPNTLVLLLNTPISLHGVSIRSRTRHHRVFLNLLGEMRTPLFELPGGQASQNSAAVAPLGNFFQGRAY